MQVISTNFTLAEYCGQMRQGLIVVNREYQRSPKVWPAAARSYLIDTVLSGYPIPKLYLYQKIDLKTRETLKEIVDGQQRSLAILHFYSDQLRITGAKSAFVGMAYSKLPPELQQRFLEYQLSADIFVGATESEIRQVFRRINSYTVPLNPQETRHATFQGAFKWFVVAMSEKYAQMMKDIGVYTEQQLSRMNDALMISEIVYALMKGIDHASDARQHALYEEYDKGFDEDQYGHLLDQVFGKILEWPDIHKGPLTKPYNFYSLSLAIAHVFFGPVPALVQSHDVGGRQAVSTDVVLANLTLLAEALENPEAHEELNEFVRACSAATTRKKQREARFSWFCRAITEQSVL